MRVSTIAFVFGLALALPALGSCGGDGGDAPPAQPPEPVPAPKSAGTKFTVDAVQIEVVKAGDGNKVVKRGSRVTCHWIGTLADGKKFKNTREMNEPHEFVVGFGNVVPGFDLGVVGMRKGDRWKMTIPFELAYGKRGTPVVPPDSMVVLEVEVLDVE